MATKTFYVTRDMKHPLYRTRMLRAGDQLELDGPTARLYRALNAVSDAPPAKAKAETAPEAPVAPTGHPYDPRVETVEQFEQRTSGRAWSLPPSQHYGRLVRPA
jgi:hypothetical protein